MKFLRAISLIFFFLTLLILLRVLLYDSYPDFSVFYYTPQISLSGGNPYLNNKLIFTPSAYPPFSFMFQIPLLIIPFIIASKIWIIFSLGALFASIILLFKTAELKLNSSLFYFFSGLSFIFFPVKFTLGMGQTNLFVLLFLSLAIYFSKKKEVWSGFFLGLSFLIKLFPLLVFPYFLFKSRKVFLFSLTMIFAAIILSLIVIPLPLNQYFYQKVLPTMYSSWPAEYYNQSIGGFLVRLSLPLTERTIIKYIFVILVTATSLIIAFFRRNSIEKTDLLLGYLILASLIINGFSWQHHFTWTLIPLFFTLTYLIKDKLNFWYYALFFYCYLLIAINIISPNSVPLLAQSHVFYGTFTLWVLDSLLILKTSGESLKHSRKKSDQD